MKYSYIWLFLLVCTSCFCQEKNRFLYKQYPNQTSITQLNTLEASGAKLITSASERVTVGSDMKHLTDHTDYIQKLVVEGDTVILPNHPLFINSKGISLKSNTYLIFQPKTIIQLIPNSEEKYEILRIKEVENVKVLNPNIVGDRKRHKGDKGEWGMGISILSSKNVTIENPIITNCWGDGIYIGRTETSSFCEDIVISKGELDYNRRNGISIISGKNILIDGTVISNTYGTAPMAGIDLEPNKKDEFLENIVLKNVTTFNNASTGIKIVFANLVGTLSSLSVDVNDHRDFYSGTPLTLVGLRPGANGGTLKGRVKIENAVWENNNSSIRLEKNLDLPVNIMIKNAVESKNNTVKAIHGDNLKGVNENNILILTK